MRLFKMGAAALLFCGCGGVTEVSQQGAYAPTPAPEIQAGYGQAPLAAPVAVVAGAPAPARWVGVAPESGAMLASGGDSYAGIWLEVPEDEPSVARPPMDLAMVVDTSGSMQGRKIENARAAARALAAGLPDGDIVSVVSFSEAARLIARPATLGSETRPGLLSAISELSADGGTNMAAGISLGQVQLARAPATHPLRRLVLVSDGMANVGPSSPAALGVLAEQGLAHGAQITSIGVGNDYDENTLNAIAVRSNGRLYHLPENQEMASILRREIDLLSGTVASDATIVVTPSEGVQILGADESNLSARGEGGTLVLPVGALFKGQRREALVRLRVAPGASTGERGLLTVRLHYRDTRSAGHVQEVVARVEPVQDAALVEARANGRTRAIAAVYQANRLKIQAAQQLSHGDAGSAEQQLGRAADVLQHVAASTKDASAKKRLEDEATVTRSQQTSAKAAAAAPPPVQRERALEINAPAAAPAGR